MKNYQVILYFHSNASVIVPAESYEDALNTAREIDLSEQIQNGLIEESHDVFEPYELPHGVIINDDQYSKEGIKDFEDDGYLVLSLGENIEYEDCETGELKNLTISRFNGNNMLCDEYAIDGKILSEIELPYSTYLYQLKESGALDAYPKVELE